MYPALQLMEAWCLEGKQHITQLYNYLDLETVIQSFSSLRCVREARCRGLPLRRGSELECIDVRRKLDARARGAYRTCTRGARDVPVVLRLSLSVVSLRSGARGRTRQLETVERSEAAEAGRREKSVRRHTHGRRAWRTVKEQNEQAALSLSAPEFSGDS